MKSIQPWRMVCSFLIAFALPSGLAQTTFTRMDTGPMVTDGADGEGCAWVDFDGDGWLDLYVSCNDTGAILLYRNDGKGGFTKALVASFASAGAGSIGAAWVDFDNDGRMDLFVHRQDERPSLLFLQQADGSFTRSALASGGFARGAAWADYDGDGLVDLHVGDSTRNGLWHNDGQGHLVAVPSSVIVTKPNASNVSWADMDNDGDMDLFVSDSAGVARLYRNDGQGQFTALASAAFPADVGSASGSAWADYDNDGFLDLFLCRFADGPAPSLLFHNNGNGTLTPVNQGPFADDLGFSVSGAWADYDNDGWLDLFVTNFGNNLNNRLYHNKGDGSFTRILTGSLAEDLGNSAGAAWGDYDRDGFPDLFVANGTNESNERRDFLYHNSGNSNSWVTVKLIGTVSNRSAIGAKVRLKATINGKPFWQLREISTGNGWSENALEAHFGLGSATQAEALRIEWPSGTVEEHLRVPARQVLTYVEPARLTACWSNDARRVVLKGGRLLRYDIDVSTNLSTWSLLQSVTITNLDGVASFVETASEGADRRFYRARLTTP